VTVNVRALKSLKGGGVPSPLKIAEIIVKVRFLKLNIPLILSKTWRKNLFITGCTIGITAHTSVGTAQKIVQG
jgi:hypothetical protein